MSEHPDTLSIETAQMARVEANRADIFLSVAGASLFSGAVALQKAREVAELVAALKTVGIEETQVKIEGIRAQTQSGTFSKVSSVNYSLRLENVPLERVAEVVGVVTSAKNAILGHIAWKFADEAPLRDELRAKCLQTALERAKSIAQTLGVRLIGIYECREKWQGTRDETATPRGETDWMSQGKARMARVSEEELGLSITHAEDVKLELTIQFRVSEFG